MTDAYLAGYENDIFISYTHVDNAPFGAEHLEWISHLHQHLKTRLEQYVGGSVAVWRDAKLTGNDEFDGEIFERLKKCALIVSVLSPRYLKSEYCNREISVFLEEHGTHASNTKKSRVFKVLKTHIDREQLPEQLQSTLGYEFYRLDEASSRPREFLLDQPTEWWRFYTSLDDLAHDIHTTLLALEDDQGNTPPGSDPSKQSESTAQTEPSDPGSESTGDAEQGQSEPSGETVYLAWSGRDVSEQREDIRRDLEARGHTVLPEESLPELADEVIAGVRSDLARSTLSIHVLGARYGLKPEGDGRSYPHIQADLATKLAERGSLHQYVWVPQDVDRGLVAKLDELSKLDEATQLDSADVGEKDRSKKSDKAKNDKKAKKAKKSDKDKRNKNDKKAKKADKGAEAKASEQLAAAGGSDRSEGLDEAQKLILHFKGGEGLTTTNTEYFTTRLEDLKSDVLRRLEPSRDERRVSDPLVYLLCDAGDVDALESLEQLLGTRGCRVVITSHSGDDDADQDAHLRALKRCEAVLVYQGNSSDEWVTAAVQDVVKAGLREPFHAQAILRGPPQTLVKAEKTSGGLKILNAIDGDLGAIDVFLDELLEHGAQQ